MNNNDEHPAANFSVLEVPQWFHSKMRRLCRHCLQISNQKATFILHRFQSSPSTQYRMFSFDGVLRAIDKQVSRRYLDYWRTPVTSQGLLRGVVIFCGLLSEKAHSTALSSVDLRRTGAHGACFALRSLSARISIYPTSRLVPSPSTMLGNPPGPSLFDRERSSVSTESTSPPGMSLISDRHGISAWAGDLRRMRLPVSLGFCIWVVARRLSKRPHSLGVGYASRITSYNF